MCRMCAIVTAEPAALADAFAAERQDFTALAATHKDGWGVASADGPTISAEKSTVQALGDPQFDAAIENARGNRFIAHIRRASKGSALQIENTHPFVDVRPAGSIALSHHGQFTVTPELREAILESASAREGRAPEGATDSELYLALITARAKETGTREDSPLGQWALAVQHAAAEVTDLCRRLTGEEPEALNTLVLTPRGLVAYEQWDESLRGKYKAEDTYVLRYRIDGPGDTTLARVIVASQGWDQSTYTDLRQGEALTVEAGSLATESLPPMPSTSAGPLLRCP